MPIKMRSTANKSTTQRMNPSWQELCMERLLEQLPNGYSDHYVPDGFVRD